LKILDGAAISFRQLAKIMLQLLKRERFYSAAPLQTLPLSQTKASGAQRADVDQLDTILKRTDKPYRLEVKVPPVEMGVNDKIRKARTF
jgi:hypothetical protein